MGDSSSWPSSTFPRTSLRIICAMLSGVGSGMERTAASTVSAIISTAASRVCGLGQS